MASFPRPAEGTWTEHYPSLGTGVVSYEDCISPEFYAIEREAVFERAWLNVGRVEDVPRHGELLHQGDRGREDVDHRRARHAGAGASVPQHLSAPREQAGVERLPARRRRAAPAGRSHASTTAGATTSMARAASCSRRASSSTSTRPITGSCRCTARCGRGSSSSTSPKQPPQSLREFLGPMITDLEGYPFDRMTERYDFRADIGCNWKVFADAFQEYYHVPMLHPQEATPATRAQIQSMGFEAPHYQLDGPHRMVSTSGAPSARLAGRLPVSDRDRHAQRPVRPVERTGPGRRPSRGQSGQASHKWAMSNFQIFPNMEILIWETGLVHRSTGTGRRRTTPIASRGPLFFAPSETASDRAARECAVVMFKEFALQDAGTLEGTQSGARDPRRSATTSPCATRRSWCGTSTGRWPTGSLSYRAEREGAGVHA